MSGQLVRKDVLIALTLGVAAVVRMLAWREVVVQAALVVLNLMGRSLRHS